MCHVGVLCIVCIWDAYDDKNCKIARALHDLQKGHTCPLSS